MNAKIEKIHSFSGDRVPKVEAEAMELCIRLSTDLWQGTVDGRMVCVWGIIPPSLMSNQAYLWLYANELVAEHQFLFVRNSQIVIEKLLTSYDTIVGHASIHNPRAIRWLKWLGAEFGDNDGYKLPFKIRKK